jgi:hypothetical protein
VAASAPDPLEAMREKSCRRADMTTNEELQRHEQLRDVDKIEEWRDCGGACTERAREGRGRTHDDRHTSCEADSYAPTTDARPT